MEDLRRTPYFEAKRILMNFPGVGSKVADCVLLFSLGKNEAFPVDIWIKRVLMKHYREKLPSGLVRRLLERDALSTSDYRQLNGIGIDYFGEYAGWAQEYLYHYERITI